MNADTKNNDAMMNTKNLEDALTAIFSKILGIDDMSNAFVETPADKNVGDSITEDTYVVVYFDGIYTDCFCTASAEEVIDMIDAAKEHNIPIYDIIMYPAKSGSKPLKRATTEMLDTLRANVVSKIQNGS